MLLRHEIATYMDIVADNMQNYHSESGPYLNICALTTSVLPKYVRYI